MSTSAENLYPAMAAAISFEESRLVVELKDGRTLYVPVSWYPRLEAATPDERLNYELMGDGTGIHWPDVVEDISVSALLAGKKSNERPENIKKWLKGRVA